MKVTAMRILRICDGSRIVIPGWIRLGMRSLGKEDWIEIRENCLRQFGHIG